MTVIVLPFDERMWEKDIPVFTDAEPTVGRSSRFVFDVDFIAADDPRRCRAEQPVYAESTQEPALVVCGHFAGHDGPHMPCSRELIDSSGVVVTGWRSR